VKGKLQQSSETHTMQENIPRMTVGAGQAKQNKLMPTNKIGFWQTMWPEHYTQSLRHEWEILTHFTTTNHIILSLNACMHSSVHYLFNDIMHSMISRNISSSQEWQSLGCRRCEVDSLLSILILGLARPYYSYKVVSFASACYCSWKKMQHWEFHPNDFQHKQ